MNRWITQAVVLGVALSEAAGNPLKLSPGRLSLSGTVPPDGGSDGAFNPANVYFEYLNQCSGSNLDKDACLVSTTVAALMEMDGPPMDASSVPTPSPSSTPNRRFLEHDDACGPPDVSEEDLRLIMVGTKEQCVEAGVSVSDQEFETTVEGIMHIFEAPNSCYEEMCADEPSPLLFELLFSEAAACAQVEPQMDDCIKERTLDMIVNGLPDESEAGGLRRKLQDSPSCGPREFDVMWTVSMVLTEAESQCSALGVSVTPEELDQAASDLASIFASHHCWIGWIGEDGDCDGIPADDSHNEHHEDSSEQELNEAMIGFEYMNRCSGADLDKDSCLVSSAFAAFLQSDGPSTDGADSTRRRFLQEGCTSEGMPGVNELMMRWILNDAKEQCLESGPVSDQEFDGALSGFNLIFNSDTCLQQMACQQGPDQLMWEIMFDVAAECAQIEPQIHDCIMDQAFDFIANGSGDDSGSDGVRRKLSHGMDGQESSACEQPNEQEVSWYVSLALSEAETKCSELGVPVSSEELDQAASDLMTVFVDECWMSLWGIDGCDEGHDHYDEHHEEHNGGGMDYFSIAIKYVEQCSGLALPDTCLANGVLDMFASWGASPTIGSAQSGHRFLQEDGECGPPELDEPTIRYLVEGSKQQCLSKGLTVSDQEMEETVDHFVVLFNDQDECWTSMCSDEPSPLMLELIMDEAASCAGALLDFHPCLYDQIFALIFAPDSPDEFDGVRRKLEQAVGSTGEHDEHADPCADAASEDEVAFVVALLLAGANEQCLELGETVASDDVATAHGELSKLFGASHCWGIPSECHDEHHEDHHYDDEHHSYSQFVEESAIWLLGQCAAVEEVSCVFSRSIEVIHGMKHLGWTGDDHSSHPRQQLAQEMALSICTPPTLHDYDIEQIVGHAKDHCMEMGAVATEYHYDQAVDDIKELVARPDCWEDLCHPMTRDIIVEEWMHTCALMDPKFLTAHGPHTSGDSPLEIDRLRCMANYIANAHGMYDENWTCTLPHLGHGVCDAHIASEAFTHCGGEAETPAPSPSASTQVWGTPPPAPASSQTSVPTSKPSLQRRRRKLAHSPPPSPPKMHLSMSFAYDDDFDWAHYEQEMSFSLSMPHLPPSPAPTSHDDWFDDDEWLMEDDEGFSMPYDDDSVEEPESEMQLYVEEVCSLISELNTEPAQSCLKPVCELGFEDILVPGGEADTLMPTPAVTPFPTPATPSPSPTATAFVSVSTEVPTSEGPTVALPTTPVPTPQPPTLKPTLSPSLGSTQILEIQYGSVEVAVEVEVTLEGIEMSEINIAEIDEVVDLLTEVFEDLIPEGAIVRILSIGGFSVARRLLRFLQDDASVGVPIQFEIVMKEKCQSAKCSASETSSLSESLYEEVQSSFVAQVETGALTAAIQDKAEAAGVSELSNVSVNASTMVVSEAKVRITEAKDNTLPVEPTASPTAGAFSVGTAISAVAVVASMVLSF